MNLLRLHLPSAPDHVVTAFLKQNYIPSDLAGCDFVFHPHLINSQADIPNRLREISNVYRGANKTVMVLIIHDYEYHYKYFDNLLLFRTSLRASRQRKNEFVIPYNFESLPKPFEVLDGGDRPRVGFCGLVEKYRGDLIEAFESEHGIQTGFIIRDAFWGGSPHDPTLIREFNRNIKQNHFTIAQRGRGNFSMRFYQTLAAGRIPVLVDTDSRLPFENEIKWRDIAIIEKRIADCVKRVKAVFSSGKHVEMQKNASDVYYRFLSSKCYFRQWTALFMSRKWSQKEERWAFMLRFFDKVRRKNSV